MMMTSVFVYVCACVFVSLKENTDLYYFLPALSLSFNDLIVIIIIFFKKWQR